MKFLETSGAVVLLVAAGLMLGENPPTVKNGEVKTRVSSGELRAQIQSASPAWFGYAMKTQGRSNQQCEGRYQQPIDLEGSDTFAVLFRVENNRIEKIHLYSMSCELDTGGLPFVWLTNVNASANLAFMKQLLNEGHDKVADNAVFILSQQAGNEAAEALIDAARNHQAAHVREQAIFWLAQRAGARSAATINDSILNDPDAGVKKKAVFALSQLPKDEGVPRLIQVAKTQRNPEVRKQAFFWLGQTHDPRALAFIEDVLTK